MVQVLWKKLHPLAILPERKTDGAAGYDLSVCLDRPLEVLPGKVILVPTGLALALPPGYEAEVRPRSGFSTKNKILMPNSPGTIDEDYRGEIFVPLLSLGEGSFLLEHGTRVAQILFRKFEVVELVETRELPETTRGEKGFGSTGEI